MRYAIALILWLVAAAGAMGQGLASVETVLGTTFVQVNGTSQADQITLATQGDGSIRVTRITAGSTTTATISADDVASMLILVRAGDGDDTVNTSAVTAAVALSARLGNGDDSFNGGSLGESVFGEAGHDNLDTAGGADFLDGGLGAEDKLVGGDGNDTILDADGLHTLTAGLGTDYACVVFATGWDDDGATGNQRRCDGRIQMGGGNDTAILIVAVGGSAIYFNTEGDGAGATPGQRGSNDVLETYGAVNTSIGSNWETWRQLASGDYVP